MYPIYDYCYTNVDIYLNVLTICEDVTVDDNKEMEYVNQSDNNEINLEVLNSCPEIKTILRGVQKLFPFIIFVNLTQNKYKILQHQAKWAGNPPSSGVYDDLIKFGMNNMPTENWKRMFADKLSAGALLEAYNQGLKNVSLRHPQITGTMGIHWEESSANLMLSDDGSGDILSVSFCRFVDSEMMNEVSMQKERSRNEDIIEILASEYSSVYYIDLNTDELVPYRMNGDTMTRFGEIFKSGIGYSLAFRLYVNEMIYGPDKKRVLLAGTTWNIREQLKNKKSFVTMYRSAVSGEPHFCEMKFVKVGDESTEPSKVALGFADRDWEICNRFVYEKIQDDFSSVYLCDLERNSIRRIRPSKSPKPVMMTDFGAYSDNILAYSQTVAEDYRDVIANLANQDDANAFFRNEERREYIYRLAGNSNRWKRSVGRVLERKGDRVISYVLTLMDIDPIRAEKLELDAKIAEQKVILERQQIQLEEALKQANAANIAKSAFLSNISHEIRTPLNAITGFAELACRHLNEPDVVLGYLTKLRSSSSFLLGLINDVLDMSRIESGQMQLDEGQHNLQEMLNEIEIVFGMQTEAKKQEFIIDSKLDEGEIVLCDKLRIQQILTNLLTNAIKYTNVGGKIKLSATATAVKDAVREYEFVVSDNGIGMSPEFVSRIFNRFERERNTTISGTQGAGLGMSITKSLVDLMNGTIEIESCPDEGTTITVRIPLSLYSGEHISSFEMVNYSVAGSDDSVFDFTGKKALLVEDNEINAEIVTEILTSCGFAVELAKNGREAVDIVKTSEPGEFAVILMDIMMPIMDGFKATGIIRNLKDENLSAIPIIAMTAKAFSEDREMALKVGMNGYVSKPIDLNGLMREIRRVIESQ